MDVPAGDEGGNSTTTNLFTVQIRLVSQIGIGELDNGRVYILFQIPFCSLSHFRLTSLLRGVAALNNLPSVGLKKLIIQQSYPAIMAMNAVVQAVGRLCGHLHTEISLCLIHFPGRPSFMQLAQWCTLKQVKQGEMLFVASGWSYTGAISSMINLHHA